MPALARASARHVVLPSRRTPTTAAGFYSDNQPNTAAATHTRPCRRRSRPLLAARRQRSSPRRCRSCARTTVAPAPSSPQATDGRARDREEGRLGRGEDGFKYFVNGSGPLLLRVGWLALGCWVAVWLDGCRMSFILHLGLSIETLNGGKTSPVLLVLNPLHLLAYN
jgi:hypothetical protein